MISSDRHPMCVPIAGGRWQVAQLRVKWAPHGRVGLESVSAAHYVVA